MLRLNTIFEAENLDPALIQLIRHKDDRLQKLRGQSAFEFWRTDRTAFETYQSSQRRKNAFDVGGFEASFGVSDTNETFFVGLYATLSRRNAKEGDWDSVLRHPLKPTDFVHEMRPSDEMKDYVARLVIEVWKDAINIVKKAANANPKVLEIRKDRYTEPFPTLMKFRQPVGDLLKIPPA